MLDLNRPLDLDDAEVLAFLADVQGNILKGHGRDFTAHLFITFGPDAGAARAWVAALGGSLTSAAAQVEQTRRYRSRGGPGEPFRGLLLSARGYEALGVGELASPADPYFRAGMERHNEVLDPNSGQPLDPINDPPVEAWEAPYREPIHAMLLLADDERARLDANAETAAASLAALGARCFVERGQKLRFDFGEPRGRLEIEHFGFQDGVSNPQMLVEDLEKERRERGDERWDPAAPAALVLTADPSGGHGSYLVFRKLEQDVAAFRQAMERLATALDTSPDEAGALVVGRHRDGRPVVPTTVLAEGADPNNFNFAEDQPDMPEPARICPFHSHIRRSNPRGDIPRYLGGSFEFERSMRIARRGITYGDRPDLDGGAPPPASGAGLLFMSFQGQLRQFAIQQSGSDSPDFPFVGAGLEGLTGRPASGGSVEPQLWPVAGGTSPHRVEGFVRMLGGEYFFAPSLPALRSLAAGRA